MAPGPNGDTAAVAVAVGNSHSCALTRDGEVWCWGNGERGRLGVSDSIPREEFGFQRARRPMRVPVSGITMLAAGFHNTCGVRADARGLLCWGDNLFGQIVTAPSEFVSVPTLVMGDRIVRHVDVDLGVICIVTVAEAVECRGADDYAALSGSQALAGADYPGRYRLVFVGTGTYCAVSVDNRAFCWGMNDVGQVRPDSFAAKLERPILIGENVSSVAVGRSYGCALLLDGNVRCWGRDGFGAVVDTLNSRIGPVKAIAIGSLATWLLSEAGEVWSLGATHPLTGGSELSPANTDFRAKALATGYGHACALSDDGNVWCWGSNLDGQLGTGARAPSPVPVRVFP